MKPQVGIGTGGDKKLQALFHGDMKWRALDEKIKKSLSELAILKDREQRLLDKIRAKRNR